MWQIYVSQQQFKVDYKHLWEPKLHSRSIDSSRHQYEVLCLGVKISSKNLKGLKYLVVLQLLGTFKISPRPFLLYYHNLWYWAKYNVVMQVSAANKIPQTKFISALYNSHLSKYEPYSTFKFLDKIDREKDPLVHPPQCTI